MKSNFIAVHELTKEKIAAHMGLARRISAGLQKSHKWVPLRQILACDAKGAEHWANPWYEVLVYRFAAGWVLDGGPWARLGISCTDGKPRHDWRVFQRIKNEVVSPEWWALELYPAESQLTDPSNFFILYAAPALPFGERNGRVLAGSRNCVAPQRDWHPDDEPPEVTSGIFNPPNKPPA